MKFTPISNIGEFELINKITSSIKIHHKSTKRGVGDDAAILEWVRNTATTIYHPTGTCKMGTDSTAVVDPRLRVHGIQGLRVADASIMPAITSGNTNAPSMMIGEKAADLVLEDAA